MNRFQYENEIRNLIHNDNNCSAHFEWNKKKFQNNIDLRLELITYNPKYSVHFLLHSIEHHVTKSLLVDSDYTNILEQMYQYIRCPKKRRCNYLVKWAHKSDNSLLNCSHFQGNHIREIVDKIYYGKGADTIIIDTIELIHDS
tara:strand:+ start:2032 stop:2460 length:429 start_codon:yes stop_codon:yes gene_type:complete